jgi:serine/threonine protein kinase
MPPMRNGTLRQVCAAKPKDWGPLEQSKAIFDIVAGMTYLHIKKFVHGNLCLDTILVDDHWEAKLVDVCPGTARGDLVSLMKEDVASFGRMLYEFFGGDRGSVGVLLTPPAGMPQAFRVLMKKCLDRDPKNRPDFRDLLQWIYNNELYALGDCDPDALMKLEKETKEQLDEIMAKKA